MIRLECLNCQHMVLLVSGTPVPERCSRCGATYDLTVDGVRPLLAILEDDEPAAAPAPSPGPLWVELVEEDAPVEPPRAEPAPPAPVAPLAPPTPAPAPPPPPPQPDLWPFGSLELDPAPLAEQRPEPLPPHHVKPDAGT